MKIESLYADYVSSDDIDFVINLFAQKQQVVFSERVQQLGLEPRSDFKNADLRRCDFSGSDLRDFDFTGSDLQGSIGVDVIWDETTKLQDARLGDTFFAVLPKTFKEEADNPSWIDEFEWLKAEDDSAMLSHIHAAFRKDRIRAMYLTKKIFFDARSTVVRNNMLYCLGAFSKGLNVRDFLSYLIAKHGRQISIMRSAVRTLADLSFKDRAAIETFILCLDSEDEILRKLAILGLFKQDRPAQFIRRISRSINKEASAANRRYFIKLLAESLGVTDFLQLNNEYIDFKEEIDGIVFNSLATYAATRILARQMQSAGDDRAKYFRATKKEALPFALMISTLLNVLMKSGISLKLSDAVLTFVDEAPRSEFAERLLSGCR